MLDEQKTKKQLIEELSELRRRLESLKRDQSGFQAGDKAGGGLPAGRIPTAICAGVPEEAALEDQLLFLQTLIDTIPGPIFYKNREGLYLGCNSAFLSFIGHPKSEIVGRTVFDVSPPDLASKYHEMDEALFENPGTQIYEFSVQSTDGNRREVIFNKAAFFDHQGRVAGLVGVILDITELRRTEEALRQTQQELEKRVLERTVELAKANRELEQEIAQRTEMERALVKSAEEFKVFAYSIVHDLKSPITALYGLTTKLKKHYQNLLDDRGRAFCDQILKASEHVSALVDQINTYVAAKESPLHIEKINLGDILQIVREEFSAWITQRSINWREPAEAVDIWADRLSLLRVFRNMVDNALKYGGERLSEISIGYEDAAGRHVFSVSDNGGGLPQEDSEKIFGRFRRRPSSGISGAGLGLAIVREIARRHGGDIWVKSWPGRKTTFYVSLAKDLAAESPRS
ncbi:MAG: ATP-binding protein [Thermodesulfobacteriota bacterium]